jgi:trimethylamine--corrinoid protein Co-methyltransferase
VIPYMIVRALEEREIEQIHLAMMSILSGTGLAVEHAEIREAYARYGARVDHQTERVWIPTEVINRFLDETQRLDLSPATPTSLAHSLRSVNVEECFRPLCPGGTPSVSTRSGVSLDLYLEPATNQVVPFTEGTLAGYIKLARLLDNDIIVRLETLPVGEGRPTQPLEARVFAWKHGALESGGIQMTELCPYLLEMYQIKADAADAPLPAVFCGSVYIISPLRIPWDVGDQIMFFYEHGLRVRIGNMFTMGGTGPVTLAGCLALNLAERVAIGILERVLFGAEQWVLFGEVAPLDMRTLTMPNGRPEVLLINLAVIQLAQHYGVPAHTYGGYTDAVLPSAEAGMQKVFTALPCILAGGCNVDAGKLGGSLCSPVQMIIDSELISALRRTLRGFDVDEKTLAVDVVDAVGPGGSFLATEHTVRHMRSELWQPSVWTPDPYQSHPGKEIKPDVARALDLWHDLMSKPDLEFSIDDETIRRLQAVVDRASQRLSVA